MTHIVDTTGLKCPLPVLLARRALKMYDRVRLITTDPASVIDVPVFCAQQGYQAMSIERSDKWEWLIFNDTGHSRESGNDEMESCLSCAIVSGAQQPLGGTIAETRYFHAHQDFAYPIAGLVIAASKRHFKCLDEMTGDESADFINFARTLRHAQRQVLDVEHVYYFYNEDTRHHFHLWMVPRYEWMSAFGKSVDSLRPAMRHAAETMSSPAELALVAEKASALRVFLENRVRSA